MMLSKNILLMLQQLKKFFFLQKEDFPGWDNACSSKSSEDHQCSQGGRCNKTCERQSRVFVHPPTRRLKQSVVNKRQHFPPRTSIQRPPEPVFSDVDIRSSIFSRCPVDRLADAPWTHLRCKSAQKYFSGSSISHNFKVCNYNEQVVTLKPFSSSKST